MIDSTETLHIDLVELTAEIVSAYVSHNHVQPAELNALIQSVHASLSNLGNASEPAEVEVKKPTPAQIRKSIKHDGLVSFLDGNTYKTLKRHLTKYGLDARSYRERYGLPADYPMTAPSYSEQRSQLAKALGLGRPGAAPTRAESEKTVSAPAEKAAASKRRARRQKAAAA